MNPSPDRWTRTIHTSWSSRMKGALGGILVGLVLFVAAFPLLIWNEGRAVRRARTLGAGAAAVVSVDAHRIDPAREGALIHVSGSTSVDGQLADADFGVSATALELRRNVEMYQWRERVEEEEREQLGGGTETVRTYEYERVWSSSAIDSGEFEIADGHRNPAAIPIPSRSWVADRVMLGAFRLSSEQIDRLDTWQPLPVPADRPPPDLIAARGRAFDDGFYVGDPTDPEVGDLRIRFAAVYPSEVSVVGQQVGQGLAPYAAADGAIELVAEGLHSAEAMFESAVAANTTLTWVLRAAGFLLLFLGVTLMLKPLSVMADVVPMVGRIIEAGTGIIAFMVAGVLGLMTVAAAWVFYRPWLGLGLVAIAIAVGLGIRRRLEARALPGRKPA